MKENDRIELINSKENYKKHGVDVGMRGIICAEQRFAGEWLVCFDEDERLNEGEYYLENEYSDDYPIIGIKEEDMIVIC